MERLLPRAATSLLLLILAARATPATVGVYNWAAIIFTAVMSLTDGAMRQVLIRALHLKGGRRFISKYQIWSGFGSVSIMGLGLCAMLVLLPGEQASLVVLLVPVVLAPLGSIVSVRSLGRLQAANRWNALATGQALASIFALAIAIPAVIFVSPIFGSAMGMVLTEWGFALYCMWAAREMSVRRLSSDQIFRASEYLNMMGYSGLGWVQGQTDRMLIGTFAGPGALGAFSMATALSRSLGDTLAASSSNLLRTELGGSVEEHRAGVDRILLRAVVLSVSSSLVVVLGVHFVVDPFLGQKWAGALSVIPILALCNAPAVLSWSGGILHLHYHTSRASFLAPVTGIAFSVPTALVAMVSLQFAAWLVFGRELILCTVMYALLGRHAPWRVYRYTVLASLLAAGIIVASQIL